MNIREWLVSLNLEKYADIFEENEVTLEDLPLLNTNDLKNDIGVKKLIDRKKIMSAIARLSRDDVEENKIWPEYLHPQHMPTYLSSMWNSMNKD